MHKAGFVNIIGEPNVGKSTIMNALVGEKLSIISAKAQTTRHRILGIVNGEDFQIVFSDTPGILKPNYKLQQSMMGSVRSALIDADIILYVTEINEKPVQENEIIEKLRKSKTDIILIINKIDLSSQENVNLLIQQWQNILPESSILAVSAIHNYNINHLFDTILNKLPLHPPFYPKDEFTDRSERFFASEIIREKILINYRQEIPYSVQIEVESFKDETNIIRIKAIIYTEKESQKGILIGNKGNLLKKTGTEARMDMEKFFGKKVFLELYVKVRKDWRNNERMLKEFGY